MSSQAMPPTLAQSCGNCKRCTTGTASRMSCSAPLRPAAITLRPQGAVQHGACTTPAGLGGAHTMDRQQMQHILQSTACPAMCDMHHMPLLSVRCCLSVNRAPACTCVTGKRPLIARPRVPDADVVIGAVHACLSVQARTSVCHFSWIMKGRGIHQHTNDFKMHVYIESQYIYIQGLRTTFACTAHGTSTHPQPRLCSLTAPCTLAGPALCASTCATAVR